MHWSQVRILHPEFLIYEYKFLKFCFSHFSAGSNNPVLQIPEIQKASEIPHFCTRIAAALEKQPPFKGTSSFLSPFRYASPDKGCQVLPLPSFADARIYEIVNENAMSILNNKSRFIGSFGRHWGVKNPKGIPIENGVVLGKNGNDKSQISIDDLQNLFNKILTSVQNGWIPAKPEEHTHILYQEDAKQFDLFVKSTAPIREEDTLIRFIATRFSMTEEQIVCYSSWSCKTECHPERPYMWIRKSDLEKVVNIFGFQFSRQFQ